jgi:hypothetical protein
MDRTMKQRRLIMRGINKEKGYIRCGALKDCRVVT